MGRIQCGMVLLTCCVASSLPARATPPQRIVSLNLCSDQVLVELVGRERIVAVTLLGADPMVSAAADKLEGLRVTRGEAEDVLARDPDLIIAGLYSTPATVDLLRRLGRRVVVMPLPDSVAGVRSLIVEMATAVEEPEAGKRLIADFDARISEVQKRVSRDPRRPSALVYQVNDYVAGAGTLIDEALRIAGLNNQSAALPRLAGGKTELESIIAKPPNLLVMASKPDAYKSVAGDNLRHPALEQLIRRVPNMVLEWPLWLCGTQHIAEAIEKLAQARETLLTSKAVP